MNILAFESSCDETSVSVVKAEGDRLTVLSNVVASQIETHRLYGGVVPEIASRAHIEAISPITYRALEEAGVSLADVGVVAVTSHPGLIGALLVAVNFAKGLAAANGIPLVAVDHIKGHIAAAYLAKDARSEVPKPPFIAMALSGGHTSIYKVSDYTVFEEIGTTRDDAAGESFDKIGRIIGIPYPAGAGFDALAKEGFIKATGSDADFYRLYGKSAAYRDPEMTLPNPALGPDTLDFSFSGLKTAAMNLLHRDEQVGKTTDRALFAARYTYEVTEGIAKKAALALKQNPGCPLVVAGGVAANSHIRARLAEVTKKQGVSLFIPDRSLCGDNGAMIAAAGYYEYLAGHIASSALNASALD